MVYNVHIFYTQSKIVSEENKVFKTISFGAVLIAPRGPQKKFWKSINYSLY